MLYRIGNTCIFRYGLVGKWVLTPETKPTVYFLLGVGRREQRTSYVHTVNYRARTGYALAGLGLEVPLYHEFFVGAEGQAIYNTRQKVDNFIRLSHRFETAIVLRGGVRF